jgi:predicted GIY-YIG superfamily endonuclease
VYLSLRLDLEQTFPGLLALLALPSASAHPRQEHIYTLQDRETGEVRYVGRAIDPQKRFVGHVSGRPDVATGSDFPRLLAKYEWAREFAQLNLVETVDAASAAEHEQAWIEYYAEQGCRLFNVQGVPRKHLWETATL